MTTALISVSDKTGVTDLALRLNARGVRLLSTGGTAKILRDIGLPVTDVSEVTGFPESLGGRVKTLHPNIHAGILARRDHEEDMDFLSEQGIDLIDIVIVNLYPFRETAARDDVSFDLAIENIDVGGPALIRAAAKNYSSVSVICGHEDYEAFLEEFESGEVSEATRFKLAEKAFAHTAAYDALVARYLREQREDAVSKLEMTFPKDLTWTYRLDKVLPESPGVASSALYREATPVALSAADVDILHGDELTAADTVAVDLAISVLEPYMRPAVCAVHSRAILGVAYGDTVQEAWNALYDRLASKLDQALVAFNQAVDEEIADDLTGISISAVLTQFYEGDSLEILEEREDLTLLTLSSLDVKLSESAGQAQLSPVRQGYVKPYNRFGFKAEDSFTVDHIRHGLLVSRADRELFKLEAFEIVSEEDLRKGDFGLIEAAMSLQKLLEPISCVVWQGTHSLGLAEKQPDSLEALIHALEDAEGEAEGALAVFDRPLEDAAIAEAASEAGIRLIIEPGFGDERDDDIIDSCDSHGIVLCFTGASK